RGDRCRFHGRSPWPLIARGRLVGALDEPVLVACEGVARQSHQRRSLLEQLTELRLIPLAVQIRQRLKKLLVPHPILILSTAQRLNSQLPKKRVRSKIPGHPTPI